MKQNSIRIAGLYAHNRILNAIAVNKWTVVDRPRAYTALYMPTGCALAINGKTCSLGILIESSRIEIQCDCPFYDKSYRWASTYAEIDSVTLQDVEAFIVNPHLAVEHWFYDLVKDEC